MTDQEKAIACLPALASWRADEYESWLTVGMALKSAGAPLDAWEHWSQKSGKYQPGACARKWNSFNGSLAGGVTLGTIAAWALEDNEGRPTWEHEKDPGRPLDWESEIGRDRSTLNRPQVHNEPIPPPAADWQGDLIRYLEALFQPAEVVSYAVESRADGDRWVPSGQGTFWMTRADLVARINKYPGDLPSAIGSWRPECGAWIRPNPMDGVGIRNDNVLEYRHVLVEADSMPIADQLAAIRQLKLPCAAIVHSGGKSIHAIVKIDAGKDYQLYRRRVATLFDALREIGFEPDRQCRNPARLSRMPGIERAGNPQYLIALQAGLPSWQAWEAWRKAEEQKPPADVLPAPLNAATWSLEVLPEPDQILGEAIDMATKNVLVAPAKSKKSLFLLQLALSLAAGLPRFLAWEIPKPRRVLIWNLEITPAHFHKRLLRMLRALDLTPADLGDRLLILNTRGMDVTEAGLPQLAGIVTKLTVDVVIVDPIYKLITGDESKQEEIKYLLRGLDRLCTETGAAILYSHHTGKGYSGDRQAIDRASGSGVFARDFDCQIGLVPHVKDDLMVCEQIARSYPPRDAFCIGWDNNRGCFTVDDEVEAVIQTSRNRNMSGRVGPALGDEAALAIVAEKPLPSELFKAEVRRIGFTERGAREAKARLLDAGKLAELQTPTFPRRIVIGTPEGIEKLRHEYQNPKLAGLVS